MSISSDFLFIFPDFSKNTFSPDLTLTTQIPWLFPVFPDLREPCIQLPVTTVQSSNTHTIHCHILTKPDSNMLADILLRNCLATFSVIPIIIAPATEQFIAICFPITEWIFLNKYVKHSPEILKIYSYTLCDNERSKEPVCPGKLGRGHMVS